jgi:hypothetical protein
VAPWTFSIKFPHGTQGSALRHPVSVYGKAPYYPVDQSTSGGACSGLNPYAGSYYLSTMTSQRFSIGTPISQPSAGVASSFSMRVSLDRDSTKDYPEIGGRDCWNPAVEGCCISIVSDSLGDQKHPMHGHPVSDSFRISIWTSTSFGPIPSWSQFST